MHGDHSGSDGKRIEKRSRMNGKVHGNELQMTTVGGTRKIIQRIRPLSLCVLTILQPRAKGPRMYQDGRVPSNKPDLRILMLSLATFHFTATVTQTGSSCGRFSCRADGRGWMNRGN